MIYSRKPQRERKVSATKIKNRKEEWIKLKPNSCLPRGIIKRIKMKSTSGRNIYNIYNL